MLPVLPASMENPPYVKIPFDSPLPFPVSDFPLREISPPPEVIETPEF